MNESGYSLVEILLTLCIIGILTTIGTLKFSDYIDRYSREQEVRVIHSALLQTRLNAVNQRRSCRLKLAAGRFELYSTTTDDSAGAAAVTSVPLTFPVIYPPSNATIDFDATGRTYDYCSICLAEGRDAAVDSVVVSETRVSLGKKGRGGGALQTISPSSERGFTLIEMLMAVLVMTVGLLGLLQSVMVAYEHNTRSALREESFRIAEDQLNLVRIVPSFNATTTVRRDIRGGTRLFEVTRGGGVPVGKSTRVSVTVVWSYRGVSYQHEVVSVKRAR